MCQCLHYCKLLRLLLVLGTIHSSAVFGVIVVGEVVVVGGLVDNVEGKGPAGGGLVADGLVVIVPFTGASILTAVKNSTKLICLLAMTVLCFGLC
jgi:hypothetical protein